MIDKPELKDAVILQQAWQIGPFADMLRLTYQRHAAYAWAHGMEYIAWAGSLKPEMWPAMTCSSGTVIKASASFCITNRQKCGQVRLSGKRLRAGKWRRSNRRWQVPPGTT